MKNKKYIFFLLFLFILCFSISFYNIISWRVNIKKINHILDDINHYHVVKKEREYLDVNINKLRDLNSDSIGWLKVDNTKVDYPVVQTTDNEYYLNHSFYKETAKSGWIFMDYRNQIEKDKNIIFYAHGMNDNTMFGSLNLLLDKDNLKENKFHYIYLSTNEYNYVWEIFSVYKILTTDDYLQINFMENDFKEFVNKIVKRSIYSFNSSVDSIEKIITLSTCYDEEYRLVVHAKLVKKIEKET